MRFAAERLRRPCIALLAGVALWSAWHGSVFAEEKTEAAGQRLVAAYPDHLKTVEGTAVIWLDGTRMVLDDGRGPKDLERLLAEPDLKDMLVQVYPRGRQGLPPGPGQDPGRARNEAFFDKMYGDCRRGETARSLVDVVWLPRKWGKTIKVTSINGVAEKLAAVSRELDGLPATFDAYLFPPAGTVNCRTIEGTDRRSAHGHGIAIDLATRYSDYWRWTKSTSGSPAWRNRLPLEIVAVFEQHGFIWGGKWSHFDTMHFEYRPELLAAKPAE